MKAEPGICVKDYSKTAGGRVTLRHNLLEVVFIF